MVLEYPHSNGYSEAIKKGDDDSRKEVNISSMYHKYVHEMIWEPFASTIKQQWNSKQYILYESNIILIPPSSINNSHKRTYPKAISTK